MATIVISTQCYPPQPGGVENLMHGLSTTLSLRGHKIIVFADGRGGEQEHAFDNTLGFTVKRYSGIKSLRRRKKARDIQRFVENNKTQGIICDSWKSLEHLRAQSTSIMLCLAHGSELPVHGSHFKAKRIKSSLARATAVIANSLYTANRTKAFLTKPSQLHIVNPGINAPPVVNIESSNRVNDQLKERSPVLISVSRLQKRKGHRRVIQLLPKLLPQHPGLLYIIIGQGPELKKLQRLTQMLNLERQVLFVGAANDREKNAYLQRSQLFLMPGSIEGNDVEGFGIAYIEAAYHGVPAIAGRSGGATEAVIDKQTGLLCSTDDEQTFFSAVSQLLGDEDRLARMGGLARQRAQSLLWTNVISCYEELLGL